MKKKKQNTRLKILLFFAMVGLMLGSSVHAQNSSPGADMETNWLPAPDGPFYCILRIYMPKPEVLNGTWKAPAMKRMN